MLLADIEVYINYFLLGLEDYSTKEKFYYEISEYQDDRVDLLQWLSTKRDYVVTFNGKHYDLVVLEYLRIELTRNIDLDWASLCTKLKVFSDLVIKGDDADQRELYKLKDKFRDKFHHIDLFLFWSKLARVSKKISLKSLAIQLGYPEIQELPYEPSTILTKEQRDVVREYNLKNDLGILRFLVDAMQADIKLRKEILQSFGIECFSSDAIKIADNYLLNEYCRLTYREPYEVKKSKFPINNYKIGTVIPEFKFKTEIMNKVYEDIKQGDNTKFSKTFIYNSNENWIKISLGIGGIHSLLENQVYYSDDKYLIITSDISSLYPNNIINYKFIRFPEVLKTYSDLKDLRIIAKKNKEKSKDTFYKLILNGTSGMLDQPVSWLHYNEGVIGLRMTGQLQLLRTTEELTLNKFQVLSLNTDGVECKVPREREQEYYDIMTELGKEFNLEWEHDIYEWIRFTNINNYIAKTLEREEKGKLLPSKMKRKGMYKLDFDESGNREIPLGDSTNFLIIPKVLSKYFKEGIPIRELVTNWKQYGFHIYDFCASKKVDRSYEIYHNQVKQQRLNRFYACRTGAYLFKKRGKNMEHMMKDSGVCIFNKYEEKEDYGINYNFYIGKVNEILNAFIMNQNTLF